VVAVVAAATQVVVAVAALVAEAEALSIGTLAELAA
jgi:hypothetical protein